MPSISVIIPNYNHGRFLKQRIETVLHQTYQDFELLLLDDASTDNSRSIMEEYRDHPKISHILYNTTNTGSPFLQWKKGIELAGADWVWIAESDDTAHPDFLQAFVQQLESNQEFGLYYTDSNLIDALGNLVSRASDIRNDFFETDKWTTNYLNTGSSELNQSLKFLCTINNASSMVVKKSIAQQCIKETTRFRYFGDWFFYINACLYTNIFYNHQALSSYRNHLHNHINTQTKITLTKQEYFDILLFLLRLPGVTEKRKLVNFFARHYLGFGWKAEGIRNGIEVMQQYIRKDASLAWNIIPKLLLNKLFFTRNKKAYP